MHAHAPGSVSHADEHTTHTRDPWEHTDTCDLMSVHARMQSNKSTRVHRHTGFWLTRAHTPDAQSCTPYLRPSPSDIMTYQTTYDPCLFLGVFFLGKCMCQSYPVCVSLCVRARLLGSRSWRKYLARFSGKAFCFVNFCVVQESRECVLINGEGAASMRNFGFVKKNRWTSNLFIYFIFFATCQLLQMENSCGQPQQQGIPLAVKTRVLFKLFSFRFSPTCGLREYPD